MSGKEKQELMKMLKSMKELMEAQQRELEESRRTVRLTIAKKRRWQYSAQASEEKVRILNKKIEELEDKVASLLVAKEEAAKRNEEDCPGAVKKKKKKVCRSWLLGLCDRGEDCEKLHSWYCGGNCFSPVAKFEASKAVYGIALPSGCDRLYTCGNGGTLHVWDCQSGQCIRVVNLMAAVRCITTQGNNWVLLGSKNAVIAWNTEEKDPPDQEEEALATWTLQEEVGQIHAMDIGNGMLFAGAESGRVAVFRCSAFGATAMPPPPPVIFQAHSEAVLSLVFEPNTDQLYTASTDSSVKVWTSTGSGCFSCIRTLSGHQGAVTSLAFWGMYLLSGSLDRSVKVWAITGGDQLMYTQQLEHGSVALKVVSDAHGKAFLLCSCNDDTVRLYDLPSFTERGQIFAKDQVQALSTGPAGTFFTGDFLGELTVWKMTGDSDTTVQG